MHDGGVDGMRLVRGFGDEAIVFGGLVLRRVDAARLAAAWDYCADVIKRFLMSSVAILRAGAAYVLGSIHESPF